MFCMLHSEPTNGAEVVAQRLEQVARNIHVARPDPMARLRDTIVFGYLMQVLAGACMQIHS